MQGTRRVLAMVVAAVAVMQSEVLAQGTSPWVDAVANLSAAFTGPIPHGVPRPVNLATSVVAQRTFCKAFADFPPLQLWDGVQYALDKLCLHTRFDASR